MLIILLYWFNI